MIKCSVDEEILDPSALSSVLITQTDVQLRESEVLEKLRLEHDGRIREVQLEREERMPKEKLEMYFREELKKKISYVQVYDHENRIKAAKS